MIRYRFIIAVATALVLWPSVSHCEGKKKSTSGTDKSELAEVRQLVEEQLKQIKALNDEVARLTQLVETMHAAQTAPAPRPAATPENVPAPTAAPIAPPVPVAESAGNHVVTKGETLTSIAKHYKTTVAELLKVNKIENDRMLQIGQTLIIPSPTPAAVPAGTPQEKKENQ